MLSRHFQEPFFVLRIAASANAPRASSACAAGRTDFVGSRSDNRDTLIPAFSPLESSTFAQARRFSSQSTKTFILPTHR